MNQQPAYSTEKNNCDGLTRIRFCAQVRISLGFGWRRKPLSGAAVDAL